MLLRSHTGKMFKPLGTFHPQVDCFCSNTWKCLPQNWKSYANCKRSIWVQAVWHTFTSFEMSCKVWGEIMLAHLFFSARIWSGVWPNSNARCLTHPKDWSPTCQIQREMYDNMLEYCKNLYVGPKGGTYHFINTPPKLPSATYFFYRKWTLRFLLDNMFI